MKLASVSGIRGARDKPKDSYGSTAYSFFAGNMVLVRKWVGGYNPQLGRSVFVQFVSMGSFEDQSIYGLTPIKFI